MIAALFIFAIVIGLASPFLRRWGKPGSASLAIAAAIVVVACLADYLFANAQTGMASIEANRKFDRISLAGELPVLFLALLSLRGSRKIFWSAWAIHLAFSAWISAILVWLRFFWHW